MWEDKILKNLEKKCVKKEKEMCEERKSEKHSINKERVKKLSKKLFEERKSEKFSKKMYE